MPTPLVGTVEGKQAVVAVPRNIGVTSEPDDGSDMAALHETGVAA
jgi:hypothetical protein